MSESNLPDVGTYWTIGALETQKPLLREHYQTCARCGSFVNSPDRHDQWHRQIEASA